MYPVNKIGFHFSWKKNIKNYFTKNVPIFFHHAEHSKAVGQVVAEQPAKTELNSVQKL